MIFSWQHIVCYLFLSFVLYLIITLFRIYLSDADLSTLSASRSVPIDKSLVFKGKIVWITGASSGIGEQLAYAFAARGAKLILSARRMGVLMKVAEKCLELGAEEAESLKTDITAPINDLSSLAAHIQRQSRFGRIDYLINAAGRRQHGLVVPVEGDGTFRQNEDRNILELNTLATISITKAVLPIFMKQKEGGVVVTISSAAGILDMHLF
jgi:dehydrogenase/reductase SDR family protein 7